MSTVLHVQVEKHVYSSPPFCFPPVEKSISFMEHCNFDNQRLCGMSRCTKSFVGGWKRMKTVIGGPYSDFTNLGKTDGEI